ncbi:hypothetical protein Hanom_Chr04g00292531 [Helianthus anomalus]
MGGPSNLDPIVELPQPPPRSYDNPIPTYPDTTGYNNPYNATTTDYNYSAPAYDPYLQAVIQNALYPPPFPPTYKNPGYPNP